MLGMLRNSQSLQANVDHQTPLTHLSRNPQFTRTWSSLEIRIIEMRINYKLPIYKYKELSKRDIKKYFFLVFSFFFNHTHVCRHSSFGLISHLMTGWDETFWWTADLILSERCMGRNAVPYWPWVCILLMCTADAELCSFFVWTLCSVMHQVELSK